MCLGSYVDVELDPLEVPVDVALGPPIPNICRDALHWVGCPLHLRAVSVDRRDVLLVASLLSQPAKTQAEHGIEAVDVWKAQLVPVFPARALDLVGPLLRRL